jgi:hypothetical protein
LAHALRQLISRPQTAQGLLGKCCLLPLNVEVMSELNPGCREGVQHPNKWGYCLVRGILSLGLGMISEAGFEDAWEVL